MKLKWPFRINPIEAGLVAALLAVVVMTGWQTMHPSAPYPAPKQFSWQCPSGTVMLETSRFFPPIQPACVAGSYATKNWK